MNDLMATDTSFALMQASQGQGFALKNKIDSANTNEQIEGAAKEFEAVFVSEMLKPMFEGLELEAPFGGGKGEEVFNSFLLQEYGKMVAQTGTIGIADHVKQELINIQEQANHEPSSH